MEFDNPAAGGQWGSQHNSDSDFSGGEAAGGSGRKEKAILGSAKKKDKEKKREKEKETKYAHLGDESSNDDEDGGKSSAGKAKKKAFKIGLTKKEKKEKKEKETKDKEQESKELKESKEAKKKEKKDKPKLKLKKSKHTDSESDKNGKCEESKWPPIFGVPLQLAVERNRCHDGVQLPVVVRECIDNIEEQGLHVEGIYRSSGVKSKVVKLRTAYSNRQAVELSSADPPVVASLLKLFLRELPDPVLTQRLIPSFEEVSKRKVARQRLEGLRGLLQELPEPNLRLIQWVFVHMGHVIQKEKVNKMTLQNVSIVLSPTMQISHRVLNCIFEHADDLFSGVTLAQYVPPLSGPAAPLPESPRGIAEEMTKQESLLAELHQEMSGGRVVSKAREEQLWEQQRIVTQLKRNLRVAKAAGAEGPRAGGPEHVVGYEEELNFALQTPEAPGAEGPATQEENVDKEPGGQPAAVQPPNSPDDGGTEERGREHRITVQIHQAAIAGVRGAGGEEPAKAHVTVIQLNLGNDKHLDNDMKEEKAEKVDGPEPEEAKTEPATKEEPPSTSALKETAKIVAPLSSTTKVVPASKDIPDVSSTEIVDPSKDAPEEERVKEKVTFSSTGLPSSRPPAPSGLQPIPLLPPPPPSGKASSRAAAPPRGLAPPDQRLKSRSLPRGLPSGGVFDGFDQSAESAEEARREALLQEEMRLRFEMEEMLNLKSELERRRRTERREIAELQEEIATMQTLYQYRTYSVDSSEESSEEEDGARGREQRADRLALLRRLAGEKRQLEQRKLEMQGRLEEERAACLQLRVNIRVEQERINRRPANF